MTEAGTTSVFFAAIAALAAMVSVIVSFFGWRQERSLFTIERKQRYYRILVFDPTLEASRRFEDGAVTTLEPVCRELPRILGSDSKSVLVADFLAATVEEFQRLHRRYKNEILLGHEAWGSDWFTEQSRARVFAIEDAVVRTLWQVRATPEEHEDIDFRAVVHTPVVEFLKFLVEQDPALGGGHRRTKWLDRYGEGVGELWHK